LVSSIKQELNEMKFLGHCKRKGAEPYHLFTVLGEHFIFDTTGCRFYKIDELTSDLLLLCLALPISQAKNILIASGKYARQEIYPVVKEIKYLSKYGLFETIDTYIDLRKVKVDFQSKNFDQLQEIQLLLAENCNLACEYCYCAVTRDMPENGLMPISVVKDSIDLAMRHPNKDLTILLFGGEPLLNKPAVDFVIKYSQEQAVIHDKDMHYSITTNATLLDDKINQYLTDYNFGLMVSLDGPREIHDAQCPTKAGTGSFDIAAENIKKLMKLRPVGVRATLTHPMPNLSVIVDFFKDFGFNTMIIGASINRNDATSSVDFTEEDMNDFVLQSGQELPQIIEDLSQDKMSAYFPGERWFNAIKNNQITSNVFLHNCGAGVAINAIDSKGNLYPCVKFAGMNSWIIGSLADGRDDQKVKEIWFNFQKAIKEHCGKCWAYPVCHGPCLWDIALQNGQCKFDDFNCKYIKKRIEEAAYLYFQTKIKSEMKEKPNSLPESGIEFICEK